MNLTFKRTSVALLLSLACFTGYAQHAVTGTVKDASGEPLIGVTVMQNGKSVAVTDIDGNFTIPNADPAATLKFSYVGYSDQEVKVGNKNSFNISMRTSDKTLDEVVVVGYGTMKRRDLTGAVASVTGDRLAANPVSNVAQALQGQLPGVNVISQDGRPGATMSIRVRGGGSITQSNDPLYVVDGVQVSRIDDIPADEIESIDVLKDAASTAIYGARGANGVILITTKSAKEGKAVVRYSMYYQYKAKPTTYDTESAYDYVMRNWSYATAYNSDHGDDIAKYFGLGSKYGNHLDDYRDMGTHNYQDDLLGASHAWNHDLSISGGTDRTKYYANVNYNYDKGSLINSGFRRWNASFKFSQKISDALTWDMNARYSEMLFKGNHYEYAARTYQFRPIDTPLGTDDRTLLGMGDANVDVEKYNPVTLFNSYDNKNNIQRLRVNTGLTWTPLKGLTAKSEIALGRNWREQQSWDNGFSGGYSHAGETKSHGYNVRWDTTVDYKVQGIGKDHSLDILLGNEVLASKSNSSTFDGYGYPAGWDMDTAFGQLGATNQDKDLKVSKDKFNSNWGIPTHTLSWFGRVNYSYLGRYLLTATFRADGSSKFSDSHHWGYFPAVAAAWRISDEPFMASTRDWLSNLKLRLSYGTSGNDNINSLLWKETWKQSTADINGVIVPTYVPGDMMGNPDLKWETTVSRNLGLDFGLWNGRLNGSLEFYWNTTKDILMQVPVDQSTGYSYQFQNVGKTSNKGLEFSLNYQIIRKKDLGLSFGMTYNFNHNNIDELMDGVLADAATGWGSTMRIPNYDYIIRVGNPVGLIQGFKSLGFYTVSDFNVVNGSYILKDGIADNTVGNYVGNASYNLPAGQHAFPGMAKYEDTDANGTVTQDDVTIIGKTTPKHTGGFHINGNYKGFDFSANFTYQIGGDVYNANFAHDMMGNKDTAYGMGRISQVADSWKMYDVDANGDIFAVTDPDALTALNVNAKYPLPFCEYGVLSSDYIEDASYLRLQNLTVGYTFPKTWMQGIGINNLRVYLTATNLFCIDGYSGIDPDVNTAPGGTNGFPTPNYDYQAYPKTRSYTFGLNLTF
jgi:TonB-linked SusC/RagA family outer membrane protein